MSIKDDDSYVGSVDNPMKESFSKKKSSHWIIGCSTSDTNYEIHCKHGLTS